jgi:hypothetical protein
VAKLSGHTYQKDGKFWVCVDMPSGEEPDPEHPSTYGYTEEFGPFDTEAGAQALLDTGAIASPKPKKLLRYEGSEPPIEIAKLDVEDALKPLFKQYKREFVVAGIGALLADLLVVP